MVILYCIQNHILWDLIKSEKKWLTSFNSSLILHSLWIGELKAQLKQTYGGPCDEKMHRRHDTVLKCTRKKYQDILTEENLII